MYAKIRQATQQYSAMLRSLLENKDLSQNPNAALQWTPGSYGRSALRIEAIQSIAPRNTR